jgi:tRNA threonylcarbamoyladenosine modification (KEOPS) complex  Pcc1 subunit
MEMKTMKMKTNPRQEKDKAELIQRNELKKWNDQAERMPMRENQKKVILSAQAENDWRTELCSR